MRAVYKPNMETCFETLRDAGIDKDQFWEMDEKDLANMGHTMGMRLRYRKGKKERDEMLRTMRCKLCLSINTLSYDYFFVALLPFMHIINLFFF